MTDRPTHTAGGRPPRRAPATRPGRVMPWLLVPMVACIAGCAMVLQAMPLEGETLAGLAQTPDLWVARVSSALTGIGPSWLMRTWAGLVSGMTIFMVASGVTVVFGLLGVISFGHGAFMSLVAFTALGILARFGDWTAPSAQALGLAAVGAAAAVVAITAAAAAGALFRRVFVRPAGGSHLKRMLLTVGGLIIAEQLILVIWGPTDVGIARPDMVNGDIVVRGVPLAGHSLMAVGVGMAVFALASMVLRFTRIGLILRAAMQDGEMVQALGYRLRALSVGVVTVGTALAALGGMFWGVHHDVVTAQLGADLMVLVVIAVLIGGLGSVTGSFLAALMIGLTQSYVAFVDPDLVLESAIAVLVLVLLWRPAGLLALQSGRAA